MPPHRGRKGTGPMISVTINAPNADIGPHWDDLIGRASPNVFMNPAALLAASETDFAKIRMLLAWHEGPGERKLAGIWALIAGIEGRKTAVV